MFNDPEFTGDKLHELVLRVEMAVGGLRAGATPLGSAIIRLCEEAIAKDREANPAEKLDAE